MGARRKREDETQMSAFGVGPNGCPRAATNVVRGIALRFERWGKVFAPQHRQS